MLQRFAQINCQTADYRIKPGTQYSQAERIAHLERRIAESAAVWGESKGVKEMRAQLAAIRAETTEEA